jgi:hypothetical protein
MSLRCASVLSTAGHCGSLLLTGLVACTIANRPPLPSASPSPLPSNTEVVYGTVAPGTGEVRVGRVRDYQRASTTSPSPWTPT